MLPCVCVCSVFSVCVSVFVCVGGGGGGGVHVCVVYKMLHYQKLTYSIPGPAGWAVYCSVHDGYLCYRN